MSKPELKAPYLRASGLWARLLLAASLVALLAGPALAEVITVQVKRNSGAEADFQRGKASVADANAAYQAGDLPTALAHAGAGYKSYPNASTALPMARLYEAKGDHKKAFTWYLRALNHNPSETFVAPIAEGLKAQGTKAGFGVVRLDVTPKEATVSVDGGTEVVRSGSAFGVSLGEHTVAISRDGFLSALITVKVIAGSTQQKTITLLPDSRPSPVVGYGHLAGGIVVAGVGAALVVLAGSDVDALVALDANHADFDRTFDDLASSAQTKHLAGWVMVGVGGAALTAGIIMIALGSGEPEPTQVGFQLSPVRGGAVTGLSGRF